MASVIRVQIRRRSRKPLLVWFNRKFAARVEAKAPFVMVGKNGDTVESLRELISVPPEIETLLRTYAQFHPVESREIEMGYDSGNGCLKSLNGWQLDADQGCLSLRKLSLLPWVKPKVISTDRHGSARQQILSLRQWLFHRDEEYIWSQFSD